MTKDTKKVIQICNQLIRIHEYKKTQYTLAAICLQFNLMNLDLPEPIWAIVGDEALVGPFAETLKKQMYDLQSWSWTKKQVYLVRLFYW